MKIKSSTFVPPNGPGLYRFYNGYHRKWVGGEWYWGSTDFNTALNEKSLYPKGDDLSSVTDLTCVKSLSPEPSASQLELF